MADIKFPKKQEQRLIPKYLLEYAEELQENHPDPSASWGGSGSTYTAGTGIDITENVISVDNTVAMKTDIPDVSDFVTSTELSTELEDYELKSEAFSGSYNDLSNKPDLTVYELKSEAFSGDYDDLTDKPDLSVYELKSEAFSGDYNDLTNKPTLFSGNYNDLTNKPSIPTKTSDLINDSGFITSAALTSYVTTTQLEDALDDYALKTDIPENVSDLTNDAGYTTQTWVQNQGYITGITSSDVTTALGYTPGTSNFSGDYDDLTDKPDLSIYETKAEAFSGNYNDLTNKPTIPTVNDNTITITQGGVTKGSFTLNQNTNQTIDVDDVPGMIGEVLFSNASGTTGDIILSASLANYDYIDIEYFNNSNIYNTTRVYNPNGKLIGLESIYDNPSNSRHYIMSIVYSLSGTSMTVQTTALQSRLTNNAAVTVGAGVVNVSKVIGYKQNSAPIVIPDIEYHSGNTYTNSNYISSTGYITSSQKELTFTIIVPKLLTNVTSVTVNKCQCLLRGVGGYVNGSSNIDYASASGYTINTYIAAPNAVTISIIKSSAYSSSTNNTPVNAAFVAEGLQLTFN